MADNLFRMPIRCYRLDRLYGPGMPSYTQEGPVEEMLEKPASQVGVVSVHCWNLGEPDGPYPIGPDAHCPGTVADWVPTAHEIVRDYIGPALGAARRAGITVFHIAGNTYGPRYATWARIVSDPELQGPKPAERVPGCVRPCRGDTERVLGPDFPGSPWKHKDPRFDIARGARPVEGEPVLENGWQLNGLCRRMDIDTLFYVGFMADVCLIDVPGAVRDMSGKGYRCVVLRECTTAYEYADTYEGRWMLKAQLRRVEIGLGYTASTQDFIGAALRAAGQCG